MHAKSRMLVWPLVLSPSIQAGEDATVIASMAGCDPTLALPMHSAYLGLRHHLRQHRGCTHSAARPVGGFRVGYERIVPADTRVLKVGALCAGCSTLQV